MDNEDKKDTGLFNSFFNESDAAMAVLNSEGLIVAANKKFENLLVSLSRKDTGAGSSAEENSRPEHFTLFRSPLLPLYAGKHNYAFFESPLRLRDGTEDTLHWFSVHAWRINGVPAETPLIGLSLEDITLVRQEGKKLLQEKEVAERAMETKGQFLANMSHEIRTPIQTIIGMTELLSDTKLDQEQTEYSRQVRFSAEVLLSLVNDILDYSKIEAGKMELEHIDFNLEQTIEEAVEMIALEAHKKELYIATSIPLETNLIINGDPSKFRQIVINLVKNAVKFTRDGGIVVSTALTHLAGREAIRVSVADTGIGISDETRSLLFSSFVQADASNTRRFGGTGLGLAISRNLVTLMNGHIETVPNEGGGSVFRFDVPLERSPKKPDPLPPPERNGQLRIFIVDDCEQERNIIESCLRDLGYTDISRAETGESALELLRAASAEGHAFQLCLIDMIMPVMDGWRLAAEIKNDYGIRQPDLILMAPHGVMGADTKMTLLKWFKAYINKPIKRRRLADTIDAVLNEPQVLEDISDSVDEFESIDEILFTDGDAPALLRKTAETKVGGTKVGGTKVGGTKVGGTKVGGTKVGGTKVPVLIAEDHPVNQKLFATIMERLGFPVILADDGQEAVDRALAADAGLVFMDIQMPRLNGYEAAEKLRECGFRKPIIAVTASGLSDERERCLKAGIDDVLIKPFKRTDIEKLLFKWIGDKPTGAGIRNDELSGMTEVTPPKNSVFDSADMLDTYMNDEELALSLLSRFVERTRTQLEGLPALVKAEDWETAHREAHMIKGAALTMGGTELGKAAARLENAFKNTDRAEMEEAFPLLKEAFDLYKKEADSFIGSRK